MFKKLVFLVVACVCVAALSGCLSGFDSENPGDEPLTIGEVRQVRKCQHAIASTGRDLFNKKLGVLERCAENVLDVQLRFENFLLSETKRDNQMERAISRCFRRMEPVTDLSTRYLDGIINTCGSNNNVDIEEIILGDNDRGDPLGFKEFFGGGEDLEYLAAGMCAQWDFFEHMALSYQMPRSNEFCELLADDLGYEEDECPEILIEAIDEIFLDPRCGNYEDAAVRMTLFR